jgi:hypothetical protein
VSLKGKKDLVNTCLGSDTPRKRKVEVLRFNLKSDDRYEQAIHIWVQYSTVLLRSNNGKGATSRREKVGGGWAARPLSCSEQ